MPFETLFSIFHLYRSFFLGPRWIYTCADDSAIKSRTVLPPQAILCRCDGMQVNSVLHAYNVNSVFVLSPNGGHVLW